MKRGLLKTMLLVLPSMLYAGNDAQLSGKWTLAPCSIDITDNANYTTTGVIEFNADGNCDAVYDVIATKQLDGKEAYVKCVLSGKGEYTIKDNKLIVKLSNPETTYNIGEMKDNQPSTQISFDDAGVAGDLAKIIIGGMCDLVASQYNQVEFDNVSVSPMVIDATLNGEKVVLTKN